MRDTKRVSTTSTKGNIFRVKRKFFFCKPFTICTTEGFVIDMLGPYLANKNYAEILKNILEDSNGLQNFLKEGDTFSLEENFFKY